MIYRPFSCNVWDLVPWSGIKPGSPAFGAQSLSHWPTRELTWKTFKEALAHRFWVRRDSWSRLLGPCKLDKNCIFSWLYVSKSILFNKLSVSYSGVRIAFIQTGQSMAISVNFFVCVRRNLWCSFMYLCRPMYGKSNVLYKSPHFGIEKKILVWDSEELGSSSRSKIIPVHEKPPRRLNQKNVYLLYYL